MKSILVTGGAGFIGSNFIRYILPLLPKDARVVNLDALTYAGDPKNVEGLLRDNRYTFVRGDIRNRDTVAGVVSLGKIDTIVHFAAETHVDRAIADPAQFVKTNVMGTHVLLEEARSHDLRFHYISTDEVYGSLEPDEAAWTEESPCDPHPPYAATKAAADHLVRSYGYTYGVRYTISHCTNNYGPRQHVEKFLPLAISKTLNGEPVPVYGDGGQIRDWIYVLDHCRAVWMILANGQIGETYNVGGGNQFTNKQLLGILGKVWGREIQMEHVEDRLGHDRRYALNTTKIRTELGWKPAYEDLEGGLAKTIEWYEKQGAAS